MHKADFPLLSIEPQLTYLDSAATSQKPKVVIDAIYNTLAASYGAIGRGLYPLSIQATEKYESARQTTAVFFGAKPEEIIFTPGATYGFNFLAQALGTSLVEGDEIILSTQEHHSNLLPWRLLAEQKKLVITTIPLTGTGELDLEMLPQLLHEKTKVISLTHASNVLGTLTDIPRIREILDRQGSSAYLIIDGCQSAPHIPLSLPQLGCDFFVASGHKLYGPSGIGLVWGRASLLADLTNPFPGGGSVEGVQGEKIVWKASPERFEAGSLNLEGALGLSAALTYLEGIGMDKVQEHTEHISMYLKTTLQTVPSLTILGNPNPKSGIVSFVIEGIHAHDIAELLGQQQICIRAGHHCAGPLHDALNITASCRASVGIYTTEEDINRLHQGILSIIQRFHA